MSSASTDGLGFGSSALWRTQKAAFKAAMIFFWSLCEIKGMSFMGVKEAVEIVMGGI